MMSADSIEKSSSVSSLNKAEGFDEKKKGKLKKAVQEFESLFVGYLLKTMRSTVPKSDMFGESFGGDILEGMFDMEMAKHISRNSGLGVGEMLYRQMSGEQLSKEVGRTLDGAQEDGALMYVPQRADWRHMRQSVGVVPADTVSQRVGKFGEMIQDAANQHELDTNLLKAIIAAESGGRADAASNKNAKGLMQLIDSTAAEMGVKDVWDPRENILGGARYLRQLLDRFDGNLTLALASYNAGPAAVDKHRGIPPYKETREYVRRVMNYMHAFESEGSDK